MPWASIAYPSIQLGIVKSLIDRANISCAPMSLNLTFFEFLAARPQAERLSFEEYDYIGEASGLGLGEWIFAAAAKEKRNPALDAEYRDYVKQNNARSGVLEWAERARELVPEFLDQCSDIVLASARAQLDSRRHSLKRFHRSRSRSA